MFKGVITALVTPLRNDRVDEEALRRLVDEQIRAGIDGLVPVGTTGESPTLSNEEHIRVIEVVVQEVKKRVPVIAGTGANATREAIELTAAAKAVGADGTLQVTPYYNKPTQDGLFRHFKAVVDAVALPMVVYFHRLGFSGLSANAFVVPLMGAAQHGAFALEIRQNKARRLRRCKRSSGTRPTELG